jgi:hypothetical protein
MALAAIVQQMPVRDALLTVEDVARRLNVTQDWVWDQPTVIFSEVHQYVSRKRG